MFINNASKGIAMRASPKPNVARYRDDMKIITNTIIKIMSPFIKIKLAKILRIIDFFLLKM
ncbi:MAG: hypothetical protein A2X61_11195 [Ignavibacteria bacterium GWB2_35_12]|nr:MAG: hypothetical protein A2X61_11195 [Ignavibacteria bacterium GWB2_35_12]OGU89746.1 MAG: hypothetical protein A2220_02760 [Ignavibacteria bacterium RIFOXYA2_FULL_35_10]OGV24002.1 MAG: hypothetical protein A2475_10840 [Ignavibacteria bacterium RIFOXYC2_FULL_35_21]